MAPFLAQAQSQVLSRLYRPERLPNFRDASHQQSAYLAHIRPPSSVPPISSATSGDNVALDQLGRAEHLSSS